ncbi:hypothetical protein NG774_05725 [Aliarcobacter cryaerophilus]|uniref:hypothetical protein n=1 Tax=Aliarcobacter cryaerophilus TaxID=28198 RepID=UPI003DA1FDF8
MLLTRIVIMPIFLRYKKCGNSDICIIDSVDNYQLRKEYIAQFDNFENIELIDRRLKSHIIVKSFSELWTFFKSYLYTLKNIFKIIFLPFNFSLLQLSNYYYLRVKLNILKPKKVYIFYSYLPQSYLIALYSTNILKIDVNYIISNLINEYLRYTYMQNIHVIFTNALYQNEYESYRTIGWIKNINVKYSIGGNEFLINKKILDSFIYDLGYFSSGFWARKDGLYASTNLSEIKKGTYKNNIYSKRENILLQNIVKISYKYNFTLKIYLHPYEKRLISQYKIYPPYWDIICSKPWIVVNESLESNDFFEAKVGVLLQSSIFYDRWENNLFTLCYQFKNSKNKLQIPLKYLSRYSVYGFKNLKELEKKILIGLKFNE